MEPPPVLPHAAPLSGRYDTAVDRESAREILGLRAEKAAAEAALAEKMLAEAEARDAELKQARRYEPARGSRAQSSLGSDLARTVIKQLGTRQGQQLLRGILGGLFKGR